MTCPHESVREAGPERCYSGCIAGDDCVPGSHGGVAETEECRDCGARRRWNINGAHAEVSPWAKRAEGES